MLMKYALIAALMVTSSALAEEKPKYSNYAIFALGHVYDSIKNSEETGHGGEFSAGGIHQGSVYRGSMGIGTRGSFQLRAEIDRAAVNLACDPLSSDVFCVRLETSVDGKLDTAMQDSKVNLKAYVTPTVRFTDDEGRTVGFGVSAAAGGIMGSQVDGVPMGAGGGLLLFIDTGAINVSANGDYLFMNGGAGGLKTLVSGNLNLAIPLTGDESNLALIGRAQVLKATERSRDVLFGGRDHENTMELKTFLGLGGTFH